MYKLTSTVNNESATIKTKNAKLAWHQYNSMIKSWNGFRDSRKPFVWEVEIKLEKVGLFKTTLLANMKMIPQNEES